VGSFLMNAAGSVICGTCNRDIGGMWATVLASQTAGVNWRFTPLDSVCNRAVLLLHPARVFPTCDSNVAVPHAC
jgi:hypothetical protein